MFLYIITTTILAIVLLYFFRQRQLRKKNNSIRLFNIALRSENDCNFEQAIGQYESALTEIKRTGNNSALKTKIREKIKLLNVVLQYHKR
ncbi:MAG: hypothetical protein ABW007_20375 [Chitinophagaceae bacterium]